MRHGLPSSLLKPGVRQFTPDGEHFGHFVLCHGGSCVGTGAAVVAGAAAAAAVEIWGAGGFTEAVAGAVRFRSLSRAELDMAVGVSVVGLELIMLLTLAL